MCDPLIPDQLKCLVLPMLPLCFSRRSAPRGIPCTRIGQPSLCSSRHRNPIKQKIRQRRRILRHTRSLPVRNRRELGCTPLPRSSDHPSSLRSAQLVRSLRSTCPEGMVGTPMHPRLGYIPQCCTALARSRCQGQHRQHIQFLRLNNIP